jgi:glycosyltransferase involved in cell wall biosynthesis
MGHNPAGRAFLLADLLSRKHDVELVGAQFPRYGSDIWEPIRETSLKMRTFPGADFPEHLDTMQRFVSTLDVDVIYACKPRLPSLALAMLAREAHGTPVIIDVDDRELAFFGGVGAADLGEVRGASGPELAQPFGEMWTRYGDGLVSGADAVTTSNHTLQSLYGGDIVAHARDELRFDPSLYDREAIRAQLGFQPDDRVVLFSGTPRLHKGIGQIADALEAIGNPRYKLCVIGTVQDTAVRDRLARMDPETVRLLPNQPFEALPSNMMAGDLVCLLQDPASEIARYQMPAKLTDALAMEVPVIATAVAPLEPLGRRGLITFIEGDGGLALQIDAAFENFDEFREQARRARSFFLKELSYEAVGQQLERTLEGLTGRSHALPSPWRCTLEFLRERYGPASIGAPRQRQGPRRARPAMADDDWDIVFCWKQNDSGLYGRRSDMLAQYLARSERVGKVVHFDAPIDFATYRKHLLNGRSQSSHQSAQIYEVTRRRTKGRAHAGDLRNYTFLHQSEEPGSIAERRLPKASEHLDWMERVLRKEGVGSRRTILWTCPVHFAFNDIVERIDHDLVVADVIDDHRAWLTAGTNYYLRVQENYRNILSAADVVLANCEPVGQRMLAFGVAAYVLPNAMEIWDGPQYSRAPAELRKLKGPIVGYVGNLSSRIDMDLLEHVVPARPDWNFVFIGSAHLSRDILRLDRHSNVHFLGVKRYPEVVAYIRAFDAGMIPHQDNEMTQAMSPLKAFVYAGCGVATVTTEIGNLTNLRSYVRTARTHEGFLAELDDVVAASVGGKDIRPPRSFLEQHTWSARVRVVEQVIDSALGDDDDGVSVPGAAAPGRASPSGQAPG